MRTHRRFGVGIIGAGWLGDVHARAWTRLSHHYPELGLTPDLVAVADPSEAARRNAIDRHGFHRAYEDPYELIADPRVDVVSVTAPNLLHRDLGVAVARSGKHLWIEKPVGLTADDARAVRDAVADAGVHAVVGFNYRAVPGIVALRELVATAQIGRPTHARIRMLTDYAAHPLAPLSWRYTLAEGGHGVLADLASHAVDLIRHVLGGIASLVAVTGVFVPQRPLAPEGAAHYSLAEAGSPFGEVENEDYVCALLRTVDGVLVTLECSRVAVGEQNNYGLEIHGSQGLVSWDFRTPGEILRSVGVGYSNQPVERYLTGPIDGDYGRFQPGAGIAMSYDDTKVIELAQLAGAVLGGPTDGPTLDDAIASAIVLEALVRSAQAKAWIDL
ncbi:MAG: Gfo/Idh/MocA family oxidoreductase [Actinomycetota bacterium]|nr:Gfo/Idh/MocA family oxidoreductase [Actinomycetota bacterium]